MTEADRELCALARRSKANGNPEDYTAFLSVADARRLAARIEALAAENARLREALTLIYALDPGSLICGCSPEVMRGLVVRMGDAARTALSPDEGGPATED